MNTEATIGFYPTAEEFGGRIYVGVRLIEFEDGGTYIAYGHVPPALMLGALERMFIEDGIAEDMQLSASNALEFKHGYGKFTHNGMSDDWFCHFTDQDINTTPITIWTV